MINGLCSFGGGFGLIETRVVFESKRPNKVAFKLKGLIETRVVFELIKKLNVI